MPTGEWSEKGPVPLPRKNVILILIIFTNNSWIYIKIILLGELGLGEMGSGELGMGIGLRKGQLAGERGLRGLNRP